MGQKWIVDGAHTTVGFTVRHMMFSKVRGSFTDVEGTVEGDPTEFENTDVNFSINVATIHTNNEDRDNHLRSADFFDTENYEKMTFKSTNIVKTGEGTYNLTGDMTIKDSTNPVTFEVEYEGTGKNPWGVDVAAFSVNGKISRDAFGLTWNQALETGGVLVGDDISITIDVQINPAQ